ncbi:MAG: phage portal protein [Chthoniobacteraceae bacterium]
MILDQFGQPAHSSSPLIPANFAHAFDAAKQLGYRGMFWFPDLDPGAQVCEWTREEIQRKINWLYNNLGAVRLVVDGLALDEVDTGLWPKPATTSAAFNNRAKFLWQQQCGFHKSFSADGRNNFYSAQYLIRREINLRGECFGLKLRRGEAASVPQLHLLPSWQCTNADTKLDQSNWNEGIWLNKFGRPIQFRFITSPDRRTWQDVASSDAIHFHDPFLIGQKRGLPLLTPVARKLFRIDDIERAKSSGVLLRTRVAYAIERAEGDTDGPVVLPGATEVRRVKQEDGSILIIQKIVSNDGTDVEVADLPAGKKFKVIETQQRDEGGEWIKELLTDVAYCTKYPPEYIFALAGLTQGTLVRMAQQKVQRVVNTVRDFQLVMQLLEEWWPFWLWQNIAAGNFADVRGGIPDQWWPYLVVRPRDMTVDMGREGRLYDDRIGSGKIPAGLYVGMIYGEDEEDFEDQIIHDAYRRRRRNREIALELKEDEIPLLEIFRPPAGNTAPTPKPDDDPDDQPPKPPEKK